MIDDKEICERVISSKPINITAMRVMLKGCEFNKISNDLLKLCQSTCPPLRMIPHHQNINPQSINFTGFKKGKIKVIGLFAGYEYKNITEGYVNYIKNNRNKWVIRCLCGMYELRSQKSLSRIDNMDVLVWLCSDYKTLIP